MQKLLNDHTYKITENMQETIIKKFLQIALLYPKNNALWINNCYYSYQEFTQIVLTIYKKIPTDKTYEKIGVYCNDDVYSYATILAINLYGAAYVPLNNKFPVDKNKKIVELCELQLILSSVKSEAVKKITEKAIIVTTCHFDQREKSYSLIDEISRFTRNDKIKNTTAYILFTSGSTGEPKGIPVSNSNLNHFFDFFLSNYDFNGSDKFLQVYELTFDVSVFSFFMPLLVGACCYVAPNDGIKFVKTLQMLKEHDITVVSMVPNILQYSEKYLNEISLEKLRCSFFSGDALYHDLTVKWKKAIPNAQIHNFYGPTETTIVCTCYPWDESRSSKESVNGIVPLGKPFPGMKVLIVDENNQPTEKGELCFSGTQVIAAYLNDTNKNSFFNHQNEIYYKTGDIASINEHGNLVFYGRTDNQVKINGYRVELREIEFAIEEITKTKSIVLCVNDKKTTTLIAFTETKTVDEQAIICSLASTLPDYMIPKQFISIENIPLNSNQKADKQALLKFIK